MTSGHLQGVVLRMLVGMIRPHRILEIGTYTGYSALSMASALDDEAYIDTWEINDELEDFTRSAIACSPWADKVRFHIGDVLKEFESAKVRECESAKADGFASGSPSSPFTEIKGEPQSYYDLIFIDGNKRQYCDYYHLALRLLTPRGYIIADNTLWDGHIIDPSYDHDAQTLGIRDFNEEIAHDTSVEKVILPLRDGLTIIRRCERPEGGVGLKE